jgi:hypothetical protein
MATLYPRVRYYSKGRTIFLTDTAARKLFLWGDYIRMRIRLWLLLSLFGSGISWLYMSRVLLPWDYYTDVQRGRMIAAMGDLYPRWVGTRELLLHGHNPYSPEVSHEIQMAFYGHIIQQRYEDVEGNPFDEQRFVYPVYVVFLLAPTIYTDFAVLQTWALPFLAILTASSVLLWLGVLRWRPPWELVAAIILLVLSSPQVMQGLRLRQLGLAVAFLLAIATWCVVRNQLAIAGIVLALSTIKPQMSLLPIAWFLLWGASDWRGRWPLLAGFGITLTVLAGLGQILVPGWPIDFLYGLAAYRKYFPRPSLLVFILGNALGTIASAVTVLAVLALAWRNRYAEAVKAEFIQVLGASLIGNVLVLPLVIPFNQVLLLLPVIVILRKWMVMPRLGRRIFALIIAWPCVCSFVMLLHRPRTDSLSHIPLLPSALVLLSPFFVLLLFSIAWGRNARRFSSDSPVVSQ